jgi:hypothetical protein
MEKAASSQVKRLFLCLKALNKKSPPNQFGGLLCIKARAYYLLITKRCLATLLLLLRLTM